jgi:hypothetical protein
MNASGSPLEKRALFRRSLPLFATTAALALMAPFLWEGPVRTGALAGSATAIAASALALLLLKATYSRGNKQMLAGLVGGFIGRLVLIAAGLLTAHALRANLFAFCASFFGLYLAHQVIEITMLSRLSRPAESKT